MKSETERQEWEGEERTREIGKGENAKDRRRRGTKLGRKQRLKGEKQSVIRGWEGRRGQRKGEAWRACWYMLVHR